MGVSSRMLFVVASKPGLLIRREEALLPVCFPIPTLALPLKGREGADLEKITGFKGIFSFVMHLVKYPLYLFLRLFFLTTFQEHHDDYDSTDC